MVHAKSNENAIFLEFEEDIMKIFDITYLIAIFYDRKHIITAF